MTTPGFAIRWTTQAKAMLAAISDHRIKTKIYERVCALAQEPEKQGKPLIAELAGYRSLRAIGQRYRIIYRVERDKVLILVVALGIRKEKNKADIYALARKLLRLRLLEPPSK